MKIVKPEQKLVNIKDQMRRIEWAGRTCYKSEEYIKIGSADAFVKRITDDKHTSVLEHGILHFVFQTTDTLDMRDFLCILNEYNTLGQIHPTKKGVLFTTNFVMLRNMTARYFDDLSIDLRKDRLMPDVRKEFSHMVKRAKSLYPIVFDPFINSMGLDEYKLSELEFAMYHDFSDVISEHMQGATQEEIEYLTFWHDYQTVWMLTNRGVTHEWVRHRFACSYSQESTRYCNYKKDKFGGISMVMPRWFSTDITGEYDRNEILEAFDYGRHFNAMPGHWLESLSMRERRWLLSLAMDEKLYIEMTAKAGEPDAPDEEDPWIPGQARDILPNGLRTEIVSTMPLYQWFHLFTQRLHNGCHEQMREITHPLLDIFKEAHPKLFDALSYDPMEIRYAGITTADLAKMAAHKFIGTDGPHIKHY